MTVDIIIEARLPCWATAIKWYNDRMPFAPQQDWKFYESLASPIDRAHARSLTRQQKLEIYKDLYRLVCRPDTSSLRLQDQHWREKLLLREKMLRAFGIR
jgi:hypothetical protein